MQRKMKWGKTILSLLALSTLALFCWPDQPTFMPEKVWGIWRTTDPRYAGRYLDISEAVFAIGQGKQRLQVFFFQRVDMKPNGPRERYTLYYRPDEQTRGPLQSFTFDFVTTDEGPGIQLNHPKNIMWFRENNRHAADTYGEKARP